MEVYDDQKTSSDQDSKSPVNSSNNQNITTSGSNQSINEHLRTSESTSGSSSNSNVGSNARLNTSELKSAESSSQSSTSSGFSFKGGNSANNKKGIRNFFWGSKRRKQTSAGGLVGGVLVGGGLLTMTLFGGSSFEFIQIAQLLEHMHFGNEQSTQDGQFTKLVRYAKYIPKGEIEKTRMGYLGNKFADHYETQLNESGLISSYSDRYGLFNGYEIDKDNPEWKGQTDEQIQDAVEKKFGVRPVTASSIEKGGLPKGTVEDDLFIDATDLKFKQSYLLNFNMLKAANLESISAVIGAHFMGIRAGLNWHPFSNISSDAKRKIEALRTTDLNEEQDGQTNDTIDDAGTTGDEADGQGAASTETQISAEAAAANKDPSALAGLTKDIGVKLVGGISAAIAILCTLKSFNGQFDQLKETQVVLPLIRMGIQAMAAGNQVMSNQDFNPAVLSSFASQLYGKDSEGNNTSWDDSESIQANIGNPNQGQAPNTTLNSIGNGSPFSFVNNIPGIDAVCGVAGQIITGVISVAIDFSGVGTIIQLAIGAVAQAGISSVSNSAAHWLAGKAVDVADVGSDYGNDIDFGAALAANQQSVSDGGTQLTAAQSGLLQAQNNLAYNQEFQQQSLSNKLFSVDDPQSLVSSIISNAKPTLSGNIEALISHAGNAFGLMAKIPELLLGKANAASTSTGYDYPFPTYGFSETDIDNPAVNNNYENACYVIGCQDPQFPDIPDTPITGFLTGTTTGDCAQSGCNQSLITKADNCFGITLAQDSSGMWDVTAPAGFLNAYSTVYAGQGCSVTAPSDCTLSSVSSSDACEWLRMRFFVLDTETWNSMGCYAGDAESCQDIGMSSGSNAASGGATFNNQAAQQVADLASFNGQSVGYSLYDSNGSSIASYNSAVENYGGSITKAMILVAYLNQIGSGTLSTQAQSELTNMIENSDDASANWVYSQLTDGPNEINDVASDAGMPEFIFDDTTDPTYILGQSQITADDFGQFFANINNLITPTQQQFGLNLLSNLSPTSQVGLLKSGLPGTVYSMEGAKSEPAGMTGSPYVVNQAAQFTDNGTTYGIAVTVAGTGGSSQANQTSEESTIQSLVTALLSTSSGGSDTSQ